LGPEPDVLQDDGPLPLAAQQLLVALSASSRRRRGLGLAFAGGREYRACLPLTDEGEMLRQARVHTMPDGPTPESVGATRPAGERREHMRRAVLPTLL